MAVEIAPVLGCATCASPLCPACLGCRACRTVSAGCVCPSPEFTADRVAARRAWLSAGRALGAHLVLIAAIASCACSYKANVVTR